MTSPFEPYHKIADHIGADAVALVPGANFAHLFDGADFHSMERPMLVVIPKSSQPVALVPSLEASAFDDLNFDGEVILWRDQDGYMAAFEALAAQMPLSSLAVEGQTMRVFVHHALKRAYPELEILDAHHAISDLRLVKNPAELTAIQEAIQISERALAHLLPQIRGGMSEKQIEVLLTQNLFAQGAEGHAFAPIVAAGANSALPHAHARPDYYVQTGDALLIDFGAIYQGFNADITRTFFIGKADEKARDVYETVRQANLAGHAATKAGVTAHDVDDAATLVLEASPYARFIRTKTGHGLGRNVHEAPYIMRGNRDILKAGSVFTIEPGLYLEGAFGVRIEDDVVVTDDGAKSLTHFPTELMEIA